MRGAADRGFVDLGDVGRELDLVALDVVIQARGISFTAASGQILPFSRREWIIAT